MIIRTNLLSIVIPQIPGNTSHYVLCGVSIPVKYWKRCDKQIAAIGGNPTISTKKGLRYLRRPFFVYSDFSQKTRAPFTRKATAPA